MLFHKWVDTKWPHTMFFLLLRSSSSWNLNPCGKYPPDLNTKVRMIFLTPSPANAPLLYLFTYHQVSHTIVFFFNGRFQTFSVMFHDIVFFVIVSKCSFETRETNIYHNEKDEGSCQDCMFGSSWSWDSNPGSQAPEPTPDHCMALPCDCTLAAKIDTCSKCLPVIREHHF